MSFHVYILRGVDGSYYTGQTDCLERRLAEHHSGSVRSCYTYQRRPLKLVFSEHFNSRVEALSVERQIKGWSRRKKEAMLRGDWVEVARLAASRTVPIGETVSNQSEAVEGRAGPSTSSGRTQGK